MNLKQQIEADLKAALLSGNKQVATTLRGLKSAILYEEVAKGKRETGLSEDEITAVLSKEAKKLQESVDLYRQNGEQERADAELGEKKTIEKYLPASLSEEQLNELIDKAEVAIGSLSQQNMGQVIGWVKGESKGAADGGQIAGLVKKRLGRS